MKIIIIFLGMMIGGLQYKLWFKPDGIKGVLKLDQQIKRDRLELEELRVRNDTLSEQIVLMKKNPKTIEEHARVVLGMIKKDETYYRIIE